MLHPHYSLNDGLHTSPFDTSTLPDDTCKQAEKGVGPIHGWARHQSGLPGRPLRFFPFPTVLYTRCAQDLSLQGTPMRGRRLAYPTSKAKEKAQTPLRH